MKYISQCTSPLMSYTALLSVNKSLVSQQNNTALLTLLNQLKLLIFQCHSVVVFIEAIYIAKFSESLTTSTVTFPNDLFSGRMRRTLSLLH